eukprot:CAMPEP_0118918112 /NCGR_PEP_ID=MMETSP1166-20130328/17713_1 /TAXON_ID=1104430 /ORGANISM="Chrysoreinhardia sp, Strain CCMP3193" /LENGTH=141 /DNA_ID=CAMNT_0006858357 /DNA_START=180 /DNA_END=605 /DNA_ORIENTATION=-
MPRWVRAKEEQVKVTGGRATQTSEEAASRPRAAAPRGPLAAQGAGVVAQHPDGGATLLPPRQEGPIKGAEGATTWERVAALARRRPRAKQRRRRRRQDPPAYPREAFGVRTQTCDPIRSAIRATLASRGHVEAGTLAVSAH